VTDLIHSTLKRTKRKEQGIMSYNYNQGGPTAPMGGGPEPAINQAGLMDVVNSWIAAVTRPSVQTYAAEVPRTSQNRLIMSIGIVTVIDALAGLVQGIFSGHAVGQFLYSLIFTPVMYLISAGAFYAGAKIMKGTGTFLEWAWVASTIWAPVSIINGLLGIIPVLGGLVAIVVSLYSIYLYYLAIQGVHRLDGSNAIIAMIIGAVIYVIGFVVIGGILTTVLLGAAAVTGAVTP
jgi:hypothetical protein